MLLRLKVEREGGLPRPLSMGEHNYMYRVIHVLMHKHLGGQAYLAP